MKSQVPDPWIWWKHGIIYHIYPRSFKDSNGDGIGDIRGIINKLYYLSDLGIDGIWLSPVFLSPMKDFGYDVSDYRRIDPSYGTMEDFKELIEKAHLLDIRVICDITLNHTSDQHPWFQGSRLSIDHPQRDWYIWKDGKGKEPPNNWRSVTGGSAWEYDIKTEQYYYHSFFKEQPDLNWRNPEIPTVLFSELRYWLDLGVDGFRLDVINLIAKDKKFRDNPGIWNIPLFQHHLFTRNRGKSHRILRELRKILELYEDRVSVGEIYTMPPGDSEMAARYLDEGKGLHMAFDFSLIFRNWNAKSYFKCIKKWYHHTQPIGWPCIVLSNHDLFRNIDRFPWRLYKDKKAKVAAILLLTLKGTPFIYYGEEIGMRNGRIKHRDLQDPVGKKYWPFFKGRDKARTPMQWDSSKQSGFSTFKPWLPVNTDYKTRNVNKQHDEPESLLNLYRSIIRIRKDSIVLQQGRWVPLLTGKNGILAYARILQDERMVIILNFTAWWKKINLPEHSYGNVVYSTHRLFKTVHFFQDHWVHPFEATIYSNQA